jgi:hypothetical protein
MGTVAYVAIDENISEGWLPSYTAHEFNHVLQFATDFVEPTYPVWEGCATAAEDWCYDEDDTYMYAVHDYQDVPWASSILHDSYFLQNHGIPWSYYEYGAVVWIFYVDDFFGNGRGSGAADLWWACIQPDSIVNEPDVLDAFATVSGMTPQEAVLELWLWRMLVARLWTPGGIEEAAHWNVPQEVALEATYSASSLPQDAQSPEKGPWDLGGFYFAVINDRKGIAPPLEIDVTGDPDCYWGAVHATFAESFLRDRGAETIGTLLAAPGEPLRLEIDLNSCELLCVGVVDLGPEGFDGDDLPQRATVTYTLGFGTDVEESVLP